MQSIIAIQSTAVTDGYSIRLPEPKHKQPAHVTITVTHYEFVMRISKVMKQYFVNKILKTYFCRCPVEGSNRPWRALKRQDLLKTKYVRRYGGVEVTRDEGDDDDADDDDDDDDARDWRTTTGAWFNCANEADSGTGTTPT